MPAVADKCFGSTRMGTKQKAWAVAVSYVEIENGGDGVVVSVKSFTLAKIALSISYSEMYSPVSAQSNLK